MATFNLNCFLTANGNTGQSGGTWKYKSISSGTTTPSGWVNGNTVSNPTALDITSWVKGSYTFTYTVTSGSPPNACTSTQDYTLVIPEKISLTNNYASPTNNYICVENGILSSKKTFTIPVTYTGMYSWTATVTNSTTPNLISLTQSSGTGSNNGPISLVISDTNVTSLTSAASATITLTCVPTTAITQTPNCATGAGLCGATISFDITVGPNFWAGTGKTESICDNSLTISNILSLFNNNTIVPTNFQVNYYSRVGTIDTLIPSPVNYTLSSTPSSQTIVRKIVDSNASPNCVSEAVTNINIISGVNSGNPSSINVCNA
jgi:hypothetical protein